VHAQLGWLDSVKAGLTLVFVRDWHRPAVAGSSA
jgi:hypothetical protein